MPIFDRIGSGIAGTALALLGAGAGIVYSVDHTPAPAAPAAAAPSAEQIGTLTVVPELGVQYVLTCRTEAGPADGAFRWQSCVPDESPDGGAVTHISEDGTASYSDGWGIAPTVTAEQGTVVGKWSEPAVAPAPVRTVAAVTPSPRPQAGACSEPLPAPAGGAPSTAPAPAPRPLVNVNTASVAELDALPGIGDVLAARIVAQRPYASVADLHRVARIPAKVFPLVTV